MSPAGEWEAWDGRGEVPDPGKGKGGGRVTELGDNRACTLQALWDRTLGAGVPG